MYMINGDELSGAEIFGWEFLGTMVLLLLGNGVCAANSLRTSAAKNTGWLLIAFGWGLAVFAGASVSHPTGGHINPAVTLALCIADKTPWGAFIYYILGQFLGAMVGALLAWAAFKQQFDANAYNDDGTESGANATIGNVFHTRPAGKSMVWNHVTEIIATFVLVLFILVGLWNNDPTNLGNLTYAGVAGIIVAIGMSLGSPTGYSLNPARDLGPRIMYAFVLPIKGKGTGEWKNAIHPTVGPLIGAALAAAVYLAIA